MPSDAVRNATAGTMSDFRGGTGSFNLSRLTLHCLPCLLDDSLKCPLIFIIAVNLLALLYHIFRSHLADTKRTKTNNQGSRRTNGTIRTHVTKTQRCWTISLHCTIPSGSRSVRSCSRVPILLPSKPTKLLNSSNN